MRTIFILTILFLSLQTNAQIRLLDQEDIVNKTPEELALMRNEIFARNGYTFSNAQYQNYFERFYRALYDNSKVKLSEIETENVNLLKERESYLRGRRKKAIEDLKQIKKELNEKSSGSEDRFDNDKSLRYALNRLDLNDIHYNKSCGIYKLTIDNGYSIKYYQIYVDNDNIKVIANNCCHSVIFGSFDDGYSDYMSESEHSDEWNFDITDDGLEYNSYQAAG